MKNAFALAVVFAVLAAPAHADQMMTQAEFVAYCSLSTTHDEACDELKDPSLEQGDWTEVCNEYPAPAPYPSECTAAGYSPVD